jgi:hypothetical protein
LTNEQPEYHHLAYLQSHRIKIDRDEQNSHVNITCIADILVDETSLNINGRLVDEMKKLAVFKVNLEEETKADVNQIIYTIKNRNHVSHPEYHKQRNLDTRYFKIYSFRLLIFREKFL